MILAQRVPGRRFFIAGSIGLILFALAHTGGVLHTIREARHDAALRHALDTFDTY